MNQGLSPSNRLKSWGVGKCLRERFKEHPDFCPPVFPDMEVIDCVAFMVRQSEYSMVNGRAFIKPDSLAVPIWCSNRHYYHGSGVVFAPYPDEKTQTIDAKGSIWEFAADRAIENAVSDVWAEFGVLHGISARYFLSRLPEAGRLLLYDSFEGIPEQWGPHPKGHFGVDKIPEFNDERVEIRKGWFEDTLPLEEPAGLIHIDSDLYISAKQVLEGINPQPGTIILFDEMFGYPEWEDNEYKALTEWDVKYKFLARDSISRMVIEVQ